MLLCKVVHVTSNIYVYSHRFVPFSVLIRETFVLFSSLICSVLIQIHNYSNCSAVDQTSMSHSSLSPSSRKKYLGPGCVNSVWARGGERVPILLCCWHNRDIVHKHSQFCGYMHKGCPWSWEVRSCLYLRCNWELPGRVNHFSLRVGY